MFALTANDLNNTSSVTKVTPSPQASQGEGILEAHSHCADTHIAVARQEGAGKTIANGTDESVPYERLWPQRRANS